MIITDLIKLLHCFPEDMIVVSSCSTGTVDANILLEIKYLYQRKDNKNLYSISPSLEEENPEKTMVLMID